MDTGFVSGFAGRTVGSGIVIMALMIGSGSGDGGTGSGSFFNLCTFCCSVSTVDCKYANDLFRVAPQTKPAEMVL